MMTVYANTMMIATRMEIFEKPFRLTATVPKPESVIARARRWLAARGR